MAETLKVLGQSNPSAATLTALYTVPASTSAVVSTVVACNRTASVKNVRLSVAVAGAADDNSQYLTYDTPVSANDSLPLSLGITLAATDVLRCYTDVAGVTFTAFGTQVT